MVEIREIEKIIDEAHKAHEILKLPKIQAMYDILASFEDMCNLILMGGVLNPLGLKGIVDQMDALNMALTWINQSCPKKRVVTLKWIFAKIVMHSVATS